MDVSAIPACQLADTVYKIKCIISRMSAGNIERLIQKYADMAREKSSSIPEKVYPHMLRRSRATHLYRNGVELELVSRILGHSSTETTRIYATPSLEMIRKAMESVETPDTEETPLWLGNEEEMVRLQRFEVIENPHLFQAAT